MEAQELKALIKESLREVLRAERLLLCNALVPYVSDAEQQELEASFGTPSDYADEEFTDMTDWVQHGNQPTVVGLRKPLTFSLPSDEMPSPVA